MESFSQRMGLTPSELPIQKNSMDVPLRNGLWNVLYLTYFKHSPFKTEDLENDMQIFYLNIWMNFFKYRYDKYPLLTSELLSKIEIFFYQSEWNLVYDFLEFLPTIKHDDGNLDVYREEFISLTNNVLINERSAYRFVNNIITPIISEIEIKSIEDALGNGDIFNSVKTHLSKSLEFFSNRDNPDYRHSIKESISAVESMCRKLTGKTKFSDAMNALEQKHGLHKSLKQGFDKIYAYTSDASGIRHAIMDDKQVHQEDALFMLVACSAFINYLQQKNLDK